MHARRGVAGDRSTSRGAARQTARKRNLGEVKLLENDGKKTGSSLHQQTLTPSGSVLMAKGGSISGGPQGVNEKKIGMARFHSIAQNRADVQKEVAKHLRLSGSTQKKIDYYYKLRCSLIHQQATPAISDSEIASYREIVEKLLKRMFHLTFS